MPAPAIHVEGLSKCYHIGAREGQKTLREGVVDLLAEPFRRLKRFGRSSYREEDTIWALKGVSFAVEAGEAIGIIGPNGAGKSTLLKILSRITDPTEGRARIRGRVASLLEVGTGFHSELTGRENIYLSGAILGMRKREIKAQFDGIVDFSGIETFIDTPVKRYSSGMRVRLGFAVAAYLNPEVLLIDEVLAVGDAEFRRKCTGKMGEVARSGRTVLFVSHDMGAVEQMCGRVIVLTGGRMAMDGAPSDAIRHYLTSISADGQRAEALDGLSRRSGMGEFVRLRKCTLLNSADTRADSVLFGEPFSLELEAIALSAQQSLSFVIGLDSFLGARISTVTSEDSGRLFDLTDGQVVRVRVRFRGLTLKPGDYRVTLSIRQGLMKGLDRLPDVVSFSVLETASPGWKVPQRTTGVVHVLADWETIEGPSEKEVTSR